jgi:hypothetical protein
VIVNVFDDPTCVGWIPAGGLTKVLIVKLLRSVPGSTSIQFRIIRQLGDYHPSSRAIPSESTRLIRILLTAGRISFTVAVIFVPATTVVGFTVRVSSQRIVRFGGSFGSTGVFGIGVCASITAGMPAPTITMITESKRTSVAMTISCNFA